MHRSRPRAALLTTLVALALALTACGSSSATAAPASTAPSPAASSGAGGGGNAVAIKDFAFAPATLEVSVGTTVTWTNTGSAGHTVTADDGSFDSSADGGSIGSGQTFSHAFPAAGTFAYHCAIHASMTGTISVK